MGLLLEGARRPPVAHSEKKGVARQTGKILPVTVKNPSLGEWLAYSSDETGRPEVYLQSLPERAERIRFTPNEIGPPQALFDSKILPGKAWARLTLPSAPIRSSFGTPVPRYGLATAPSGSQKEVRPAPPASFDRRRCRCGHRRSPEERRPALGGRGRHPG
jgi:hypothetical protein